MTPLSPGAPEQTPPPKVEVGRPPEKPMDMLAARKGCYELYGKFLKFQQGVTTRLEEMGFPDRVRRAQEILERMKGGKKKVDEELRVPAPDGKGEIKKPEDDISVDDLFKDIGQFDPTDPKQLQVLLSRFSPFRAPDNTESNVRLTPVGRVMSEVVQNLREEGDPPYQSAVASAYKRLEGEKKMKREEYDPDELHREAVIVAKRQIVVTTAQRLERGRELGRNLSPLDGQHHLLSYEARVMGEIIGNSLSIDLKGYPKNSWDRLIRAKMLADAFADVGPEGQKAIDAYCKEKYISQAEGVKPLIDKFLDKKGIPEVELTPEEVGTVFIWTGIGRTPAWYGEQKRTLEEKGFKVVCASWPKYGDTYNGQEFTFDAHPDYMRQVMEKNGVNPGDKSFHIGHSRGGLALMKFLEKYGDAYDISGAIISSAPAGNGPEGVNPVLYKLVKVINELPPGRVKQTLELFAKKFPKLASKETLKFFLENDPHELTSCYRGHIEQNWESVVENIDSKGIGGRVVYTWGVNDGIMKLVGSDAPYGSEKAMKVKIPYSGHTLSQGDHVYRFMGAAIRGRQMQESPSETRAQELAA